MNSEYLFSKKGSDVEIERMEDLLSVYRIEPVPPALKRTVAAEEHSTRQGFRFLFAYIGAIASLATIVITAVMVVNWQTDTPKDVTAISPAVVISPALSGDNSTAAYSTGESTTTSAPKPIEPARRAAIRTSYARASRPVTRFQRRVLAAPKLTAEEKYAYEQVKVALYLAGSKLKMVQDTIDRTGDNAKNSFSDKR
jgi:hypothetical protein